MIRASTLALALALGFAAAPAIASPPGATPSKTPARANCGTAWTGWTEDPNTDLNPCPKNCERGERQLVKSYKQGDKTLFSARYQCYRAAAGAPAITTERLVVNGLELLDVVAKAKYEDGILELTDLTLKVSAEPGKIEDAGLAKGEAQLALVIARGRSPPSRCNSAARRREIFSPRPSASAARVRRASSRPRSR